MEQVIIRNLGVGALLIEADQKRLLVDAFNDLIPPVAVLPDDILLFTHDDGDHFSAARLPLIKGANVTVVGPPTIVKPIMSADKADVAQIQVLYSNQYAGPAVFEQGDIRITCYATHHFNHWDPIHNSYLLEIGGRKIFITGDSEITEEMAGMIGPTDAIICNLVDEDYLKGKSDSDPAMSNLLNYLVKIQTVSNTEMIIGVHLIAFEWSVDEREMKKLVDQSGYNSIVIPTSCEQEIYIG